MFRYLCFQGIQINIICFRINICIYGCGAKIKNGISNNYAGISLNNHFIACAYAHCFHKCIKRYSALPVKEEMILFAIEFIRYSLAILYFVI